ncbi:MAG: DNA polymerase I [Myxococcota bacterium]
MQGTLVLIDANSNAYRAFFALPPLSNAAGVPTNAVLGFVSMLHKVLREVQPDFAAVVWDPPSGGTARRRELFGEYKAQRDAQPEDLQTQLEWIRRVVDAQGLPQIVEPGEEADDVIATLARRGAEAGLDVRIISTDKDLMQLVNERIHLLDTQRDRDYGPDEVESRFGVPPDRMLDLRALTGDSSDNIPGVRGIGAKGAAQLLAQHGSLDALLEAADAIPQKRYRKALRSGAEAARLSRELSRLRDRLPLATELEDLKPSPPDSEALAELYRELELKRLLEDLGEGTARPSPGGAASPDLALAIPSDLAEARPLSRGWAAAERIGLQCVLSSDDPMSADLVGVALAVEPGRAVWLSVARLGEEAVVETLRPALERPEVAWTGWDLKGAWVALEQRGSSPEGSLRDLAVAAYVVDPAPSPRLPESLARSFLGRTLPSREAVLGKGRSRQPVGSLDVDAAARLFGGEVAIFPELDDCLGDRLEASGQRAIYEDIEVPLVGVLARMERAGVRIDEARLERLSRELEKDLEAAERKVFELAGEEFKIGSPKQLQRILFEKLKLPPTKRTKTGFSTDESVLEDLASHYELPAEILAYRRIGKLKSTYVDALPPLVHPETGRIHARFHQTTAATGRLSVSNPSLQNIPIRTPRGQQVREAFIPAEGCVLLSSDYSQIELRILAHLSRDEALLDAFRRGQDIHVRTASEVFGIPEEQVSPEQRSRMKGINFGIIYGSSAFGIARQLGIAQAEAREHIRAYFERYPGVRRFLDSAVREARARGYSSTLFGRRRYLPDLDSRNRAARSAAERMAVNSVLQGTAADIIKRAMIEIDRDLRTGLEPGAGPGPASGRTGGGAARMILQVHDELLFEVTPERAQELQQRVERRMRDAASLEVPLEVHSGIGASWREAH